MTRRSPRRSRCVRAAGGRTAHAHAHPERTVPVGSCAPAEHQGHDGLCRAKDPSRDGHAEGRAGFDFDTVPEHFGKGTLD